MLNHSITDHMAPYDVYGTPDLIYEDFRVIRVVICLLWSLDRLSINI